MGKEPDKRMLWIRNLEAVKRGDDATTEAYELGSEAEIHGVLDYGEASILCGPLTFEPTDQGLYKYLLKLRVALPNPQVVASTASAKGYIVRHGLIGELVGVLSIALETRFFVLSSSTGELSPSQLAIRKEYRPIHKTCTKEVDPIITTSRSRNFRNEVTPILQLISQIPSRFHNDLSLAFWHYAKALQEVAVDEEMVFIRLVSAIEAVDSHAQTRGVSGILARRPLDEIVRVENLDERELQEVKSKLEAGYLKRWFVYFLEEHSKGFFKGGRVKAPNTKLRKRNLSRIAKTIYDARSQYLHSGIPMYLSLRIRGEHRWDMDPSMGMTLRDRKYKLRYKLPYSYWFHRLVRHCLLNYAKGLIKKSPTSVLT